MRIARRSVRVAVLVVVAGGLGGSAAAADGSPPGPACTFTVRGPTAVHASHSFDSPVLRGKHTGDSVTSSFWCISFVRGFHAVVLSTGKTGWIWAANLTAERPVPPVRDRYQITGTVDVLTAPSPSRSTVLTVKHQGDAVSSPWLGDYLPDGYAEVLMADGDLGWIDSAFVKTRAS